MRDRAAGWIGVSLAAWLGAPAVPGQASARPLDAVADALALPERSADSRPLADDALQRIVDAVQKRYNARVVKVTEIMVDGKRAYELRLLSDERVWTVRVDAETGQELSRND